MLCGALECILRFALPFLVLCLVYTWGAQASEKSKRKNPAVYTNDKRPTHLDKDSWSVKEPSLGEECTLQCLEDTINLLWAAKNNKKIK